MKKGEIAMTYDWIIGICCSESNGIRLYRFRGKKEEAKERLLSLVREDRRNDTENWVYGCESLRDIQEENNNSECELYGYGNYVDYHIEYTAKVLDHIYFLKENINIPLEILILNDLLRTNVIDKKIYKEALRKINDIHRKGERGNKNEQ